SLRFLKCLRRPNREARRKRYRGATPFRNPASDIELFADAFGKHRACTREVPPRNRDATIDERLLIGAHPIVSLLEIVKLAQLQRIQNRFVASSGDSARDTFDGSRCPTRRCKRADRWLDAAFTAEVASCRDRKCVRVDLWKARVR